jgi:hypothetical protein
MQDFSLRGVYSVHWVMIGLPTGHIAADAETFLARSFFPSSYVPVNVCTTVLDQTCGSEVTSPAGHAYIVSRFVLCNKYTVTEQHRSSPILYRRTCMQVAPATPSIWLGRPRVI